MVLEIKIETKNVSHFFSNKNQINNQKSTVIALIDINIKILDNTLNVIFGPSGSGKSTLLKVIADIIDPLAGEVYFNNINVNKMSKSEKDDVILKSIGYLSQNVSDNILSSLSANEIISILKSKLEIYSKNEIIEILQDIGLNTKILDITTKNLSGGEKQRIAFLLLLIRKPDILILDEPTSHLDTDNIEKFIKIILELKARQKTIVIATHDPNLIAKADTIYFIEDGRIRPFSTLNIRSDLLDQTLLFISEPSESNTRLKIPEKIFSQLQINTFYLFFKSEDDKQKYSFNLKICNMKDLENREFENWVYIDNPLIKIPNKYQKFRWAEYSTFWYINKNGVQFILKEK